ncbi:hypothetical protein PQR01_25830, partial [Paraburkholderia rhynchosiae]
MSSLTLPRTDHFVERKAAQYATSSNARRPSTRPQSIRRAASRGTATLKLTSVEKKEHDLVWLR